MQNLCLQNDSLTNHGITGKTEKKKKYNQKWPINSDQVKLAINFVGGAQTDKQI